LPRLALALLLYTGQRCSDVVRMGRQRIRNDLISVRQQKTGTPLLIPVHPALRTAIEAMPSGHLTFLDLMDNFHLSAGNLRTVGYGKTRPKNPSDLNAPENRRVEVVNLAPQAQASR
jgi:integrase